MYGDCNVVNDAWQILSTVEPNHHILTHFQPRSHSCPGHKTSDHRQLLSLIIHSREVKTVVLLPLGHWTALLHMNNILVAIPYYGIPLTIDLRAMDLIGRPLQNVANCFASCILNDQIYVFEQRGRPLMHHGRVHGHWRMLREPPAYHNVASAMSYNDQLLAICDFNNNAECEEVQAYNPVTNAWSKVCHMRLDGEFQAVVARETGWHATPQPVVCSR